MTKNEIMAQIDACLTDVQNARLKSQYDDLSDLPDAATTNLITKMAATIDRLAPEGSRYRKVPTPCSKNTANRIPTICRYSWEYSKRSGQITKLGILNHLKN